MSSRRTLLQRMSGSDPSALAANLTYTGTLAVALLMFLCQLTSFAILLALAGTLRLLAHAIRAIRPPAEQANRVSAS
ncbi:uncharacterized BrkB/YihY/UPF0761 family membrane protein [Arthrobacter sp. MP_M7]|nr:uncharacterized BrkB/YihY/UPF0761 family membrane protein [Arthrobacter sp. MP_M4]MEC5202432.1 uncharacterized BrkB/YihY/UPF0761 family membrane protein [Arthrobacter sp. MP_M7]